MIQVEEFITDQDVSPFRRWFDALDHHAAAWVMIGSITPLAQLQGAQGGRTGKEELMMSLTRNFRETVQARACRDAKFRRALLGEAMQALLDGDLEEGRAALRSCINATVGFEKLGAALGRSPKSLMRMFGPAGNPTAENLLGVIGLLQTETGVRLQVRAVADAA